MFKVIIYYGLIILLSSILILPLILTYFLKKALKKYSLQLDIKGFFSFKHLSLCISKQNSMLNKAYIEIDSLLIKKIPKKFEFLISMRDMKLRLGYHELVLDNINNQNIGFTGLDDPNQVKNIGKVFRILSHLEKINKNMKSPTSTHKDSRKLNENSVFFKAIIKKIVTSIAMKIIKFEARNIVIDFVPTDLKNSDIKNDLPALSLQIQLTESSIDYLKTDCFLIENIVTNSKIMLLNSNTSQMEEITIIQNLLIKMYMPFTLRTENAILNSTTEIILEELDVNLIDDNLDNIFEFINKLDLMRRLISLSKKHHNRITNPELFQKEVLSLKSKNRIKANYVPIMPKKIKFIINKAQISFPVRSLGKGFDTLYFDDIITICWDNMNSTTTYSKLDDLKYPSKLAFQTKVSAENVKIKAGSMRNDIFNVEKFDLDSEYDLSKIIGEALHLQHIKNSLKFTQCEIELSPLIFLISRKIGKLVKKSRVYRIKSLKPIVKYFYMKKYHEICEGPDVQIPYEIFEEVKAIYSVPLNDEQDDLRDVKLMSSNFVIKSDKIHGIVSDLEKSFFLDLYCDEFIYMSQQNPETWFHDIRTTKLFISSPTESKHALVSTHDLDIHIPSRFKDSKDAKSSISSDNSSIRLNDYICIKILSLIQDFVDFFMKLKKTEENTQKNLNSRIARIINILTFDSALQLNIRNIVARYDYSEHYSFIIRVDSLFKKSQKLCSPLYYPSIDKATIEFLLWENDQNMNEESSGTKIIKIDKVIFSKEFKETNQTMDFSSYCLCISFSEPHVIIPYEFKEALVYIKTLVESIMFVVRHAIKGLKRPTINILSGDYNFNNSRHDVKLLFKDFRLIVEDSPINYALTKFQNFVRNFLSKTNNMEAYEIIRQLKISSELRNSLFSFEIKHSVFHIGRYFEPNVNADMIMQFFKSLDGSNFDLKLFHFSKIKGQLLDFMLEDVRLDLKDYCVPIAKINKISFRGPIIRTTLNDDYFTEECGTLNKIYSKFRIVLNSVHCGFGPQYIPVLSDVIDWIRTSLRYMKTGLNSKSNWNEDSSISAILSSHESEVPKSKASFWDKMRYKNIGYIEIDLPEKTKLQFLTHTSPYIDESLIISTSYCKIRLENGFQLRCDNIKIKRSPRPFDETHIVKIPTLEITFKLLWQCNADPKNHYTGFIQKKVGSIGKILNPFEGFKSRGIDIQACLNIPLTENIIDVNDSFGDGKINNEKAKLLRKMIKNSGSPVFHIQAPFLDWIFSLPQLRKEMLRLYRININEYSEESNKDMKDVYTDYIELIKHTFNSQLNKGDEEVNPLKLIKTFNLRVHIGSTRVIYSNIKVPFALESNDMNIDRDDEETKKIDLVGVQTVIDSMTFSCKFDQKAVKKSIDSRTLKKLKTKKKKKFNPKVWRMKEGVGKLNFVYASVFDGKELLPLKPIELEKSKLENESKSLSNPKVFKEFFLLKDDPKQTSSGNYSIFPAMLERRNSNLPDINYFLLDPKKLRSISYDSNEESKSEKNYNHRSHFYKYSSALPQIVDTPPKNENNYFDFRKDDQYHKDSPSKAPNDFDYSGQGIFFKADLLIYQQDQEFLLQDEEEYSSMEKIEHLLTFSGLKLLVTIDLKNILKHFLVSQKLKKKGLLVKRSRKESTKFENKDMENSENDIQDKNSISFTEVKDDIIIEPGTMDVAKRIKFVIKVEKPQFNLQYSAKESQLLLASRRDCTIMSYEFRLPFDSFRQDLKYLLKTCFNSLECFVASTNIDLINKKVFWLDNKYLNQENVDDDYQIKEGMLLRIISCNRAFFNYTLFDLDECFIDFSKKVELKFHEQEKLTDISKDTEDQGEMMKRKIGQENQVFMWKDEPRINSLIIKAGKLLSFMDSNSFITFRHMLDFIIILVADQKKRIKSQVIEMKKTMFEELKHVGKNNFTRHMKSEVDKHDKTTNRKKSKIEYSILNGAFHFTEDEKAFIALSFNELLGSHTIFFDESTDYILQMKSLEISNLMQKQEEEKTILSKLRLDPNSDSSLMFFMGNHSYFLPGILNKTHKWRVYENFEFRLSPLIINLTEDVYHKIYEFFFQEQIDTKKYKDKKLLLIPMIGERDHNADKNEDDEHHTPKKGKRKKTGKNEHLNLPSYYRNVIISDFKADFSFKSASMFKRLSNVKILMSAFVRTDKFWTSKKFFDSFESHLIKQSLSQAFSIIGQKLGISTKELHLNDESKKELEKKKKMLLGTN